MDLLVDRLTIEMSDAVKYNLFFYDYLKRFYFFDEMGSFIELDDKSQF